MLRLITNPNSLVAMKLVSGHAVLEALDLGFELKACNKKTRVVYTIKSHRDFDSKLKEPKENYEYYLVERGV